MRAATKGDSSLAVGALMRVCGHRVHSSAFRVLLECRPWVFGGRFFVPGVLMIAFPHVRASTSNAPCPCVKWPVALAGQVSSRKEKWALEPTGSHSVAQIAPIRIDACPVRTNIVPKMAARVAGLRSVRRPETRSCGSSIRWRSSPGAINSISGQVVACPSDRASMYGPYHANEWAVCRDGVQDGHPCTAVGARTA